MAQTQQQQQQQEQSQEPLDPYYYPSYLDQPTPYEEVLSLTNYYDDQQSSSYAYDYYKPEAANQYSMYSSPSPSPEEVVAPEQYAMEQQQPQQHHQANSLYSTMMKTTSNKPAADVEQLKRAVDILEQTVADVMVGSPHLLLPMPD